LSPASEIGEVAGGDFETFVLRSLEHESTRRDVLIEELRITWDNLTALTQLRRVPPAARED
jgi:hypothetical protein